MFAHIYPPIRASVVLAGLAAIVIIIASVRTPDAEADGATAITAGGSHTCLVNVDGGAMCFGLSDMGQTGLGTATGPDTCGGQSSDEYPCAKTAQQVVGLESGVVDIDAGHEFTCALKEAGGVFCWGRNSSGQLGNLDRDGPQSCTNFFGTFSCSTTPVHVARTTSILETAAAPAGTAIPVEQLAVGGTHACVLTPADDVWCWGSNIFGQLGIGNFTGPEDCGSGFGCTADPIQVQDLDGDITAISAGDGVTCALFADHSAQCWGLNSNGEIGIGNWDGPEVCFSSRTCSTTPRDVAGADNITALNSGSAQTCALTTDDTVKCWGIHTFGQLGTGSIEGPEECGNSFPNPCSDAPNPVPGLESVMSAGTSDDRTVCVVMQDRTARCWGANNLGQMGTGASGPETCKNGFKCQPTPTAVMNLSDVSEIAAGGDHTCAILTTGAVKCWGYKFYGATGDNTWSPSNSTAYTPVDVIGFSDGRTPTPTPVPPGQHIWADLNCSNAVDPVDSLASLRSNAGLSVNQGPDCPGLDDIVDVNGLSVAFADIDCDGSAGPVDSLKILRNNAGLSVSKAANCPDIGEEVLI